MPLIEIPKDSRAGKEPCGECHVSSGETCDICGARHGVICEHDFQGWRELQGGGEKVCTKCGAGAMSWSLKTFI